MSDSTPIDETKPPGSVDGPNVVLPEGSSSMDLTLGPILVRVRDIPAADDPFVRDHYGIFAKPIDDSRTPDLEIRCRVGEGIVVPLPPKGGITELKLVQDAPGRFTVQSHWQDGWVDVSRGEGEVVLTSRQYIPLRMSLENYLRVASQLMLVEKHAFLMHAAGVLDEGRCFVFFGPSGAGKSTATANSAPREALSDDIVLIDASGETPRACAVPFYGAFPPKDRAEGTYPIAAMCRLRQDPEDRIEPLSPARAAATVSASIPFVNELGLRHDNLNAVAARLMSRTPAFDLYLTKSGQFWDLLRDAVAG